MTGVFDHMFPRAGGNRIKFHSFSAEEANFRAAMAKISGAPRSQTLGKYASERARLDAALAERRDIAAAVDAMGGLVKALSAALDKAEMTQARERERMRLADWQPDGAAQ